MKTLINFSTYQPIDIKNIKNLLPYSLNALLPKKKFAFTLAEVLITLGIIGIVAAMTIPTLISTCNKIILETKLRETNAIILQAFKRYQADEDESTISQAVYDDADAAGYSWKYSKAFFEKYLANSFNTTMQYPKGTFPEIYSASGKSKYQNNTQINTVFYMLNNGTIIGVIKNGNYEGVRIWVIFNSQKKKLLSGKDVFQFEYVSDGVSGYYEYSPFVKKNYSNTDRKKYINACISEEQLPMNYMSAAQFCTFLIMQNNFKIPKDYPIKL